MLSNQYLRLIFTVGMFLSGIALWSQSGSDPLITDLQVTNGDSTYRYLYLYGDDNLKTLETKYVLVNNDWSRRVQTEWIYSNNLCITQYVRKWLNSQWILIHKINFTYSNNLPATETHFQYVNDAYVPEKKHIWTYSNNKLISEADSSFNNNVWKISAKTDYKYKLSSEVADTIFFSKYEMDTLNFQSKIYFDYNASVQPVKQTYAEKKGMNWINALQTISFYDSNFNKKTYQTIKTWNNNINYWENSQNITYTYDVSGNVKTETYQRWKTQFWENDIRYDYTYDTNNNVVKKITYLPIYEEFRPASSINYSDFQYGKASLIEANYEFWGGETGSLINTFIPFQFNAESAIKYGSKIKISYIPVNETGTTTLDGYSEKGIIEIYPNPSASLFYFNTEKYDIKSWTITDVSGKVILKKTIKERTGVIDLGNCKSGVYIFQAETEQGVLTQKIIKI